MSMQQVARYQRSALFQSSDLDETRQIVSGLYCDHRLDQTQGGGSLAYRQAYCRLGDLGFSRMEYGADVRVEPGRLGDFYLIQVPLSGVDHMTADGVRICSDPGHASIHAPGSGLGMHWSEDCRKFVVRIERAALERHAAALSGHDMSRTLAFRPVLDLQDAGVRSWVSTAQHVLDQIDGNPRLADEALVRVQFEQLLMTTLLSWLPGNFAQLSQSERRTVLPRHVKAAEEYMRAHPEQALTVESLAQEVGVSGRTLFEGFRKFLGVSPMRYLRDLRMDCARRDLLDPAKPRSVTAIATHWGFYQLGRFACEYRRRFDEQPHETMARAR